MDIFEASKRGNLEEIKRLLKNGTDVNVKNRKNTEWTPLMYATRQGRLDVIKFLLDYGANFDLQSAVGTSPLMDASYFDRFAVVKLLLKRGANPNLRTMTNETALYYMSRSSSHRIVLLFQKYADRFDEKERELLQGKRYRCRFTKEI